MPQTETETENQILLSEFDVKLNNTSVDHKSGPVIPLDADAYYTLLTASEAFNGVLSGLLAKCTRIGITDDGNEYVPCCPWGMAFWVDGARDPDSYFQKNPGPVSLALAKTGIPYKDFDAAIDVIVSRMPLYLTVEPIRVPLKDVFDKLGIVPDA